MQRFDYIIVGAGSSGCVLANRLSENPRNSVLLIEAGGRDSNPLIKIPMLAGVAYFWKPINWNYQTVPQANLDGRAIAWPRGRVLGGSSTINGMMYMRGNRADYDGWAAAGLKGWSYQEVLPYFRRSEGHLERPEDEYHSVSGQLAVVRAKGANPLYADFLAAGRAEGARANDDFNGPQQDGLGLYDFNIRNGRRESTSTAFLRPALGRKNLTVWTKAMAKRLTFEGLRATGIEIERDGGIEATVTARREIVLCCGAINSPQLLQLSGIGDAARLKAAGVMPLLDRRDVGRNLQDHLGVYLKYRCTDPITLYGLFRPDRAVWAGLNAMLRGQGPATSIPLEAGGFLKTRADLAIPDIHITFVPGLNLEATRAGQGQHGYLINFYQLRPESRGEIAIAGPEATAPPRIDPNYLATENDRRCLREGVRLAHRIGLQPPLARRNGGEISPLAADLADDAAIDAWVRASSNTIFHPVGTCRMGADDNAVLDAELRVRGIENLRVVDASAMPALIGGNTSAPAMMIAEKAADMILGRPQAPAAMVGVPIENRKLHA